MRSKKRMRGGQELDLVTLNHPDLDDTCVREQFIFSYTGIASLWDALFLRLRKKRVETSRFPLTRPYA